MTAVYNKSEPSNSLPVVPTQADLQKHKQLEIISLGSAHDGKRPFVPHKSEKQLAGEQKRGIRHLRLLDRTLREKLFYMTPTESRLFGQLVESKIVRYQQRNLKGDCYLRPSLPQQHSLLSDRAAVHKSLEKRLEKIPDEFVRGSRRKARRTPEADGQAALQHKASMDHFKSLKAASTGNLFRLRSHARLPAAASSLFSLTQPAPEAPRRATPAPELLLLKQPGLDAKPRSPRALHAQSRGHFVRQNIKKQREQEENRAAALRQKQPFLGWQQLKEQLEASDAEDIFPD